MSMFIEIVWYQMKGLDAKYNFCSTACGLKDKLGIVRGSHLNTIFWSIYKDRDRF